MRPQRNPWTNDEVEVLKRMLEEGHTPVAVTEVLKSRTLNAIRDKMDQLGLKVKYQEPDIDWETYRALTGGDKHA